MEVVIALRLPRDAASVPVIRQMLNAALGVIGVDPQIRDDIQLMLAEACSNVIRHADDSVEYAVEAEVSENQCVLKVADNGGGLPDDALSPAGGLAESGRGIQIMRALADVMRVADLPHKGLSVRLEKTLQFSPDAPGERLQTVSANGVDATRRTDPAPIRRERMTTRESASRGARMRRKSAGDSPFGGKNRPGSSYGL